MSKMLKISLKKPQQEQFITYCDEVSFDNKVILMTTWVEDEDGESQPYYAKWFYSPKKDIVTVSIYEGEQKNE